MAETGASMYGPKASKAVSIREPNARWRIRWGVLSNQLRMWTKEPVARENTTTASDDITADSHEATRTWQHPTDDLFNRFAASYMIHGWAWTYNTRLGVSGTWYTPCSSYDIYKQYSSISPSTSRLLSKTECKIQCSAQRHALHLVCSSAHTMIQRTQRTRCCFTCRNAKHAEDT